eukprot:268443-Pleurochrysis_carterae.AAC.2
MRSNSNKTLSSSAHTTASNRCGPVSFLVTCKLVAPDPLSSTKMASRTSPSAKSLVPASDNLRIRRFCELLMASSKSMARPDTDANGDEGRKEGEFGDGIRGEEGN